MAYTSGCPQLTPLWDPESPGGMNLFCESEYQDPLIQHWDMLLQIVDIRPLKAYLMKYGVVDTFSVQDIMAPAADYKKTEALIEHVQKGPVCRFHGWLKSLADSGQGHIIKRLGIDPRPYTNRR